MKTWIERHLFLALSTIVVFLLCGLWAYFKYIKKENVLEDIEELNN